MQPCFLIRLIFISIHAPVWGATCSRDLIMIHLLNFNPRTRMGCDAFKSFIRDFITYFNPRTRMGCDLLDCISNLKPLQFQSTHPYGVRQIRFDFRSFSIIFQSTHPYGVRLRDDYVCQMCGGISIHAPVWGATTALQSSYRSLLISIHAPVWGATFLLMRPLLSSGYFNPRARMGCDLPNV